MWKLIPFVLFNLPIVYISRTSLRQPKSHGFYRFFVWEAILVIFLLNIDFWFHDPFAWNQIISWAMLIASLIPLAFGVQALRAHGKPTAKREGDPSLLSFEKTTQLVTNGIYQHIRHPLYSSLLLLAWGIFFKLPSWSGLAITAVATTFLFATAKADENECIQFFGEEYRMYMRQTKRFIPFLN